jgi:glycosyltransferase involved in cell wall biosynthesis
VEEVIKHNKNGILVDFFDTHSLSKTVNEVLNNPDDYKKLKTSARKTIVDKYDLKKICLPEQIKIVEGLL